jgi:hypothetical protein
MREIATDSDGGVMQSLWRAMALVWLGGIASPALAPDAAPFDTVNEERPLELSTTASRIASVERPLGPTEHLQEPSSVTSGSDRHDCGGAPANAR